MICPYTVFSLFKNIHLFIIYLAVSGLGCGTRDAVLCGGDKGRKEYGSGLIQEERSPVFSPDLIPGGLFEIK